MPMLMRFAKCIVCLTIICIISGCPPQYPFEPSNFIGGYGTEVGQFINPKGIDVEKINGAGEFLFVADYGNNRIQIISTDKKNSSYAFGKYGSNPGQFNSPISVAIDHFIDNLSDTGKPSIYVTDSKNNRVQKFDFDGQFILSWGECGSDTGQFNTPYGIDIDNEGHVYVADSGNHRIQVFDTLGNFLQTWGKFGHEPGSFDGPLDLVVVFENNTSRAKYIAVTDYGNNCIQIFDTSGKLVTEIANIPHPLGITSEYNSIISCGEDKYVTSYNFTYSTIEKESINEMGAPYDIAPYYYISDQATHRIYNYWGFIGY